MHRSLKIAVPAVIFVFLAAANASAVITGRLPAGSAFNPMTGRVYVANSGADSVTVIDGASSTVLATVPVGTEPGAIAVNTATNRVYVASFLDNRCQSSTASRTRLLRASRSPANRPVWPWMP